MYNYREAIKEDVKTYITENREALELDIGTREDIEQRLNDELWTVDSVTGNGSGSYTFSAAEARENIMGDADSEDIIRELVDEYGLEAETVAENLLNWEYWDVSIRCYLLSEAIAAALDELQGEM